MIGVIINENDDNCVQKCPSLYIGVNALFLDHKTSHNSHDFNKVFKDTAAIQKGSSNLEKNIRVSGNPTHPWQKSFSDLWGKIGFSLYFL